MRGQLPDRLRPPRLAARPLPRPAAGIHADLPQSKEVLVHRSGGTGRAGKHGLAILIAPEPAHRFVERLLASARVDATWHLAPSADDIRGRDQAHLAAEIQHLTDDLSDADRIVARTLLADRSAEDLVAALVHIRRQRRPAAAELTVPTSMRPRPPAADRRPPPRLQRERPRFGHAAQPPERDRDQRPPHPPQKRKPPAQLPALP